MSLNDLTRSPLGRLSMGLSLPQILTVRAAMRRRSSIMHGVDVEPIMRWDMPVGEMIIGVLEVLILGWLFGAVIAVFYNLGAPKD